MLQGHFYHKTIRKLVAAFGTMFNSIIIAKYDPATMKEQERIKVPLTYAQKEKYIYSIIGENVPKKIMQVELPRMSFEMTGLGYDSSRKLPSLNQNFYKTATGAVSSGYTSVPYDFQFSLAAYTRNIEDMSQIIEQIVPYFTPDYTVTIALVDENGVKVNRDIPIILNGIIPEIQFEPDGISPRMVIYEFTFTVKAYLFGPLSQSSIIRKAYASIYDTLVDEEEDHLIMTAGGAGSFNVEEDVYSGPNWQNATWTGRVYSWNATSRRLNLYSVKGVQLPQNADVVYGYTSGARWAVSTANRSLLKHAEVTVVPNPLTANVGDANLSFTTVVTEFPHITDEP